MIDITQWRIAIGTDLGLQYLSKVPIDLYTEFHSNTLIERTV